jgi:hypothetical protein
MNARVLERRGGVKAEAYYSHNQSIFAMEKEIVDRLPVPGLPCLLVLHRIFQSHRLLDSYTCHTSIIKRVLFIPWFGMNQIIYILCISGLVYPIIRL